MKKANCNDSLWCLGLNTVWFSLLAWERRALAYHPFFKLCFALFCTGWSESEQSSNILLGVQKSRLDSIVLANALRLKANFDWKLPISQASRQCQKLWPFGLVQVLCSTESSRVYGDYWRSSRLEGCRQVSNQALHPVRTPPRRSHTREWHGRWLWHQRFVAGNKLH